MVCLTKTVSIADSIENFHCRSTEMALEVIGYVLLAIVSFQLLRILLAPIMLKITLMRRFPVVEHHWFWGSLKYFENLDQVLPTFWRFLQFHRKYYVIFVGPVRSFLRIVHPEYAKIITNSSEPKSYMYNMVKPWLGNSILLTNGPVWKRNRRLLTPAFHFDNLRGYVSEFSQSANDLFSLWRPNDTGHDTGHNTGHDTGHASSYDVEVFEQMSLLTLDSFMKCAFGQTGFLSSSSSASQPNRHPYVDLVNGAADLVVDRARNPFLAWDWLYFLTPNGRQYRRTYTEMHRYAERVIAERRKQLKESVELVEKKKHSFIDIVLMARDSTGNGLTDEEIRMEVDTFMFAGHDTTTSVLAWSLYNLALHAEHQQLCRQNVVDVLGDRREVSWEDLSQLDYLTMTIKESMRLFPTVPNVSRMTTKDVRLPDGAVIPAGTHVGVGIESIHRHPDFWTRPEVFDPSRFSADKSAGRHSHAFMPFSAGPRNCIGQHFALAEAKTVLALTLQRFRVELDGSWPAPRLYPSIVLRSLTGVHLKFFPL